jgi:formylmethanofuran dehydrogenase subunit B
LSAFGKEVSMDYASIAGKPATLDAAVAQAAKLLGASRRPLIAGLGTDIGGARAAITLARRTGAAIDHMNSDAVLRDLGVMSSSGTMLITPTEADVRADTLLLVGTGLIEAWPQLPERLFGTMRRRPSDAGTVRSIYWLCPRGDFSRVKRKTYKAIGKDPRDLPALLAALRAHIAGRPTAMTCIPVGTLDEVAAALKAAHFGVAVWSTTTLDALSVEMLCGLVDDLNATTRFSGLPLAAGDNAIGVLQACGWMTGFPMRSGFGLASPRHDPWLFDSRRIVDNGEADCALWISAYRTAAPPWRKAPPTIALTGRNANFAAPPIVHIEVGRPGVDHATIEHLPLVGALVSAAAAQPSDKISVAAVLERITAALPEGRPC